MSGFHPKVVCARCEGLFASEVDYEGHKVGCARRNPGLTLGRLREFHEQIKRLEQRYQDGSVEDSESLVRLLGGILDASYEGTPWPTY